MAKKSRADRGARLDVPVRELSGLDVEIRPDGTRVLWAIGDCDAVAAFAILGADGRPGSWRTLDLATLNPATSGPGDFTQMEGVACDGAGKLVILREHPSEVVVVDPAGHATPARLSLVVPDRFPRAQQVWAADPGSAGEAILLMRAGHVLVVKEKNPAGFAEFGPPGDEPLGVSAATLLPHGEPWQAPTGDTLLMLDRWLPEYPDATPFGDISDAALGPRGEVVVLSDKSQRVGTLAEDLTPGTLRVSVTGARGLPLVRDEKPEGLVVLPDGTLLIGIDTKKPKGNLLVQPPLVTD